MKLPYIKVELEYREEETGAPGRLSPTLIAGFGLHWAWIFLFMFNGQYLLFPEAASMQTLLSGTSGVVHAAVLLGYAVFLKKARELFGTPQQIRRNRLLAACLVACATILCFAGNLVGAGPAASAIFVGAGVLSGIGSAMFLMSFGVSFSVCDLPTIALSTALSIPVSALLFAAAITVGTLFVPASALFCLALPFLELLCLNKCSADLVDKLEFAYLTMPVRTASFAARVGVPSLIFGVMVGVLRTCSLAGPLSAVVQVSQSAAKDYSLAIFTASLFVCLALILAMLTLRKSRNFSFRVFAPLMAALLVMLCAPFGEDGFFRGFAMASCYFMLEASLWTMYSDIAQSYRVSAFTTFGFGHGLLSAGSLAGYLLLQPGGPLAAVLSDPVALAMVGFVTLTFGVATLPNAAEMRSTLIRGRFCPLFDDRTDLEELMSGEARYEMASEAPSAEGAEAETPEVPKDQGAVEAAVPAPDAVKPQAEAKPQTGFALSVPEPGPAIAAPQESPEQRAGRFKRKCAAVADTFLLSRKETEVLFLLAKGRNSAAIQESLYISAGTANTHMRHIYRKLDVHSQHELIDLVESMKVE
ncbi:helix-turn-helix transcriptional regulator [Adlercreutzia sp. R25]|uniref:response regulator transcription factor n=1 Tax=Adlercreutzia shanghongiae TaxID=3111773 RepID=UPI002DBA231E|nr:helix-turn-helix transcriptional regulator [Adlercreutzia sp. R25]MEC4272118.1 helix-turn-helix transcriptional regulator [Adlercreutzia sp. R25]